MEQALLDIDDSTLEQVSEQFFIPPKPEILAQLQAYCEREDVPIRELSDLIAQDVSISSAVLKIINSPAFGLARTVSDIKQAVMFLGEKGVITLVQSIKLKQAFAGQDCQLNLDDFWDYSLNIANATMLVGRYVKSMVAIEDLYSLGLFHDCGVPPLAIKHNDFDSDSHLAMDTASEDRKYSTNHAVIGFYIASGWNLPKPLCQLILEHHNINYLKQQQELSLQASYCALKLAEHLVLQQQYERNSPDWYKVEKEVIEFIGLTEDDMEDLKEDVNNLYF